MFWLRARGLVPRSLATLRAQLSVIYKSREKVCFASTGRSQRRPPKSSRRMDTSKLASFLNFQNVIRGYLENHGFTQIYEDTFFEVC